MSMPMFRANQNVVLVVPIPHRLKSISGGYKYDYADVALSPSPWFVRVEAYSPGAVALPDVSGNATVIYNDYPSTTNALYAVFTINTSNYIPGIWSFCASLSSTGSDMELAAEGWSRHCGAFMWGDEWGSLLSNAATAATKATDAATNTAGLAGAAAALASIESKIDTVDDVCDGNTSALAFIEGKVDAVDSNVDLTLARLGTGSPTVVDAILNRLGSPAGASVSADIGAVKSQTNAMAVDAATAAMESQNAVSGLNSLNGTALTTAIGVLGDKELRDGGEMWIYDPNDHETVLAKYYMYDADNQLTSDPARVVKQLLFELNPPTME